MFLVFLEKYSILYTTKSIVINFYSLSKLKCPSILKCNNNSVAEMKTMGIIKRALENINLHPY